MRITRIRLLGFKSFAQKTEFNIDPGITAIVGPNGCGKSNVFDAVKWVLGEQKPSSLRAREMMDVIFAGAGGRKALGLAEVSLCFDNSDGTLAIDRPEVVLTRRLYRSGESEYLLNGDPCRLKDLREALMDTGSGLDAFSIMEQGRIDAILTANPVERRAVFEEAAGIGKFKARRKEAMRRLERIGEDLTRLRDVIELTDKQLRSLRYQASRARRWREISEELRKQKVTWALNRYHAFLGERAALSDRLAALAGDEARAAEALRGLLGELGGEEAGLERAAAALREAESALLALDAEIRSARESAEHGRKMAEELDRRVKYYEGELRTGETRRGDVEKERDSLADELAALGAEAAVREGELATAENAIRSAAEAEKLAAGRLEAVRRDRLTALARHTDVRNERAALSSLLRSGDAQRERMVRRRAGLLAEGERLRAAREAGGAAAAAAASAREESRALLRRSEEELDDIAVRHRSFSEEAAEVDLRRSAAASRLELLKQLRQRHEGMDRAVQEVLKRAEHDPAALPGIRGVVANLIEVEAADAESVELALGVCAQAVVTETLPDALRAIEFLKGQQVGRAVFVPLSEVREPGPSYDGNGAARHILSAVRAKDEYRPLVRALLSDSIVVERLDDAVELTRGAARSLRVVTGGGEVMSRIGAITGGRGKNSVALLRRNAEIEALEKTVAEEAERREILREAIAGLDAARERQRALVAERREAAEAAAAAARDADGALARLSEDLRRVADEEKVLLSELSEVDGEAQEAAARDADLSLEDERLRARGDELTRDVAEREAALEAARRVSKDAEAQRGEVRVALARARERLTSTEARVAALAQAARDIVRNLALARTEMETCSRRRDEAAMEAELSGRRAAEAEGGRERRIREVEALRSGHAEVRDRIQTRRREAESLREEHDRYRGALEEFRLREHEIRTKIEGLIERVREEFGLDLGDLYQGFVPGEGDPAALDQAVADLKDKLEKMGNVNLEALDQLKEVEERSEFLTREEADLNRSREALLEVLRKLNRESRERFEKAFADIREHFREMFRRLFGGGNAEVSLVEGEDILEAGVEIKVRPPGRDLQNLNLLSGGEKTLTAVALLLAIFKSHPSPFALMDEVDAALDESNIDRFLGVLREFSDRSQFVMITHNKRTMAEADALYGVSMPEVGVSQQVSIRFRRGPETPPAETEPAEAAAAGDAAPAAPVTEAAGAVPAG